MVHTVRAALAVALLAGVYVLGAAVVVGLGYMMVIVFRAFPSIGPTLSIVLIAMIVVPMWRGLLSSLRAVPDEPTGLDVSPAEQPRLWDEITMIADQVGVAPPDELRLVVDANAGVSDGSRWLGLVGGVRCLYLGVPLLIGLTRRQLQAVIAHELGHYSDRHTTLGGVAYRGTEALRRVDAEVGGYPLFGHLFRAYARLYVRISHGVNRMQEFEADRFSARIAGRSTAIASFLEMGVIAHAWTHFAVYYAMVGVPHGMRPDALFSGFAQMWAHADRRAEIDRLRASLPERERSPYDSHPSTAERIAAFEALPDDGRADRSGSAVDLLDDSERTLARVEAAMFADDALDAVPWERMIAEVTATEARAAAAALAKSAEQAGVDQATLWAIVQALHDGRARDLVAPVVGESADADAADAAAAHMIGQTIAAAVVDGGRAGYRLDWSGPARLVDDDGHTLDPWGEVERAVGSRAAVADLERWLAANHVPAAYRAEPEPDPDPRDDDPAVHGAIADIAGGGRVRFLFVCNHGLLLRRPDLRDRLTRVLLVWGDHIGSNVRRALRRPVAELIADRRSTLVPWPDIELVEVTFLRMLRMRMTVTTVDGGTRRLKGTYGYQVHGEAFEALMHHLGDRLVYVERTAQRSITRGRAGRRKRAPTASRPGRTPPSSATGA